MSNVMQVLTDSQSKGIIKNGQLEVGKMVGRGVLAEGNLSDLVDKVFSAELFPTGWPQRMRITEKGMTGKKHLDISLLFDEKGYFSVDDAARKITKYWDKSWINMLNSTEAWKLWRATGMWLLPKVRYDLVRYTGNPYPYTDPVLNYISKVKPLILSEAAKKKIPPYALAGYMADNFRLETEGPIEKWLVDNCPDQLMFLLENIGEILAVVAIAISAIAFTPFGLGAIPLIIAIAGLTLFIYETDCSLKNRISIFKVSDLKMGHAGVTLREARSQKGDGANSQGKAEGDEWIGKGLNSDEVGVEASIERLNKTLVAFDKLKSMTQGDGSFALQAIASLSDEELNLVADRLKGVKTGVDYKKHASTGLDFLSLIKKVWSVLAAIIDDIAKIDKRLNLAINLSTYFGKKLLNGGDVEGLPPHKVQGIITPPQVAKGLVPHHSDGTKGGLQELMVSRWEKFIPIVGGEGLQ